MHNINIPRVADVKYESLLKITIFGKHFSQAKFDKTNFFKSLYKRSVKIVNNRKFKKK